MSLNLILTISLTNTLLTYLNILFTIYLNLQTCIRKNPNTTLMGWTWITLVQQKFT